MFGFMLFLHLTGLFVWLGALLGTVIALGILKRTLGSVESNQTARRMIRAFNLLAHPASVIVLGSGVYLIVQLGMDDSRPLWLEIMEKGGGTIILAALVVTGIMGSRAGKRLASGGSDAQSFKLKGYVAALSVFMILIVSVMLVVSIRV